MASSKAATQILLSLNLLLFTFTMVSSTCIPCSTPPKGYKSPPVVPQPQPPSTGTKQPSCPKDTLKLSVCADLLGLVNVQLGKNTPCCSLIQGLADLDAAVCLCTALRANVLGINLNIAINLALLLNLCGKNVPKGFVISFINHVLRVYDTMQAVGVLLDNSEEEAKHRSSEHLWCSNDVSLNLLRR